MKINLSSKKNNNNNNKSTQNLSRSIHSAFTIFTPPMKKPVRAHSGPSGEH